MRCPIESKEHAELLLDYCARKLDPAATRILEAHMSVCEPCRRFRDGQRALWESLDRWEAIEVSSDFNRRLYRRIDEEEARAGGLSRWWRETMRPLVVRPAVPLTAMAGLVLAVGFLLRQPAAPPVVPDAVAPAADVEQVERTLEDMEMLRQFNLAPRRGSGPDGATL